MILLLPVSTFAYSLCLDSVMEGDSHRSMRAIPWMSSWMWTLPLTRIGLSHGLSFILALTIHTFTGVLVPRIEFFFLSSVIES